jgi:hypothetical protein
MDPSLSSLLLQLASSVGKARAAFRIEGMGGVSAKMEWSVSI